jgi:Flp pilus assembly protein TadG
MSHAAQRGAAAVELALLTIPLILLVLAAVEFSRVVYHYNVIAKATRDGARILSAFSSDVPAEYPTSLAVNRVVYGQDTTGSQPLIPGLTPAMVKICDKEDSSACTGAFADIATGSGTINLVRVQVVGYPYTPIFSVGGLLPTHTFGPIGTTMLAVR